MNSLLANTSNTSNSSGFRGFAAPTSNTTYTPNQFFDVCFPHHSRGCVRLVAFLIRKTLGWCDADGNPQSVHHLVSYSDFEAAGISRPMINEAIKEAIGGHFVRSIRSPKAQKAGQPAVSGLYELQWDERPGYLRDPKEFRGFFAGEGNRTYIPNQYFDHVVQRETLAVVKMVGAVIRFSIGFQNKFGHRRRNVSLSYQHIQNYSHVRDRKTLSSAIQHAMKSNYIERVEQGYFDPNAGKLSRAAVYAVRWLDSATDESNGKKIRPGSFDENSRSEKPTGNGKKTQPGERLENPTDIEIKQTNKTLKQKQSPESAASFELLKAAGFDGAAARAIADRYSFDRVERQINWLPDRKAANNPLGMLRKAIEEDWQAPEKKLSRLNFSPPPDRWGEGFDDALQRIKSRYWDQPSSNST